MSAIEQARLSIRVTGGAVAFLLGILSLSLADYIAYALERNPSIHRAIRNLQTMGVLVTSLLTSMATGVIFTERFHEGA